MKSSTRNININLEHKLVSFVAVVALWTLETLLIKLIRILLKRNSTRQKQLCHFGRYVAEAKLFCVKSFVQVSYEAGVFKCENFHPGYRDLANGPRARFSKLPVITDTCFRHVVPSLYPPKSKINPNQNGGLPGFPSAVMKESTDESTASKLFAHI